MNAGFSENFKDVFVFFGVVARFVGDIFSFFTSPFSDLFFPGSVFSCYPPYRPHHS